MLDLKTIEDTWIHSKRRYALPEAVEGQVHDLIAEVKRLRQRLLTAAGDDLCRLTQEEIKDMSAGGVPIPPKEELLASCERFHAQVAGEAGVNQNCLTLAQLIAENERLSAIVAAIQPGTAEATVAALWELAWRECNHPWTSSRPPILAVEDEIKRLRALLRECREYFQVNLLCEDAGELCKRIDSATGQ